MGSRHTKWRQSIGLKFTGLLHSRFFESRVLKLSVNVATMWVHSVLNSVVQSGATRGKSCEVPQPSDVCPRLWHPTGRMRRAHQRIPHLPELLAALINVQLITHPAYDIAQTLSPSMLVPQSFQDCHRCPGKFCSSSASGLCLDVTSGTPNMERHCKHRSQGLSAHTRSFPIRCILSIVERTASARWIGVKGLDVAWHR